MQVLTRARMRVMNFVIHPHMYRFIPFDLQIRTLSFVAQISIMGDQKAVTMAVLVLHGAGVEINEANINSTPTASRK